MLVYSMFLFSAIVTTVMEKCTTRFFLVKIGDAEKRTSLAKANLSVDLLKEQNVDKGNSRKSVEWLHFQHLETNRYIGNPKKTTDFFGSAIDGGNLVSEKSSAGEHTICDMEGNSLKLSDVKDGMFVKIRARKKHWLNYDYLYTSQNNPTWGYCYYGAFHAGPVLDDPHARQKQTWRVQKGPDSKFHFESMYWGGGNYLSGNDGNWLYVDDVRSKNRWKVTHYATRPMHLDFTKIVRKSEGR